MRFFAQDVTTAALGEKKYHGAYSTLVFLHIPRAPRLIAFRNLVHALKPGAFFYNEDIVL